LIKSREKKGLGGGQSLQAQQAETQELNMDKNRTVGTDPKKLTAKKKTRGALVTIPNQHDSQKKNHPKTGRRRVKGLSIAN